MNELPSRPTATILRAAEADAWIDGYGFLQAAREEAERVRQDSQQWLRAARDEGFAEARRHGDEQVIERLAQTAQQVDSYLAGIETALVDLALGVVREVLDQQEPAALLLSCTRKALLAFRQDQHLTLFVPTVEVAAVREQFDNEAPPSPLLNVEADAQLAPGQARLSGPTGTVEVGLEAQLQNIRRSLLPFAGESAA
ncbi:FliH/SctL family protein [Pseudomonas sp. SZMC_28357]|uniref:FliH/SctL family protein n=1 Tax=Pseudomonas sp. SZMC_28357 TaxID=3074380 RepID=UPI0028721F3D|nr:FliH/SctL family protein [Pseudomonas sp. SZMC_28357]MDR9750842.1 FliH/SctL family protein [Pseudomonas sp. SZMC_28357]